MSHIEIKLVAATAADLSSLIAGLHSQLSVPFEVSGLAQTIEDAPVVVGRIGADVTDHAGNEPEKAKPTAAKPAAEKPKPAPVEKEKPAEDAATVAYTDVQMATNTLAKAKGTGAVREILASFDVDHATKLTEAQWQGYIDACALAAG